jgi:tRNA(Ile)-lysidine synthase
VRADCRRHDLFPGGAVALVMVSGGQDSVALLHMLATRALGDAGPERLHVLHVNHALRGQESEDDQALVAGHCAALAVPLTTVRRPVSKAAGNLQATAREARRAAARQAAADVGATRIVLGHTLDDQVETLLYRLGRYAGLDSLAAMHPRSGQWVRPLLTRRRAETAAYCVAHGLTYATDRGNADEAYVRTAIRRYVVPAWEEALPGAVVGAGRAAAVAAEAAEVIDEVVAEAWAQCCVSAPWGVGEAGHAEFSAARLNRLSGPTRHALLHTLLGALDGAHRGRNLVVAAEALLARPGSSGVPLGGGWVLVKEYDRVRVTKLAGGAGGRRGSGAAAAELALSLPGTVVWKDIRISAEWAGRVRAHDPRFEAYLDARTLAEPLTVRAVAACDHFRPLGAPGSRLVQDLIVDLRVPRAVRGRLPLVLAGGRPVWLCGFAVADESRIRSDTDRAVRLCVDVALPSWGNRGCADQF